jgi:prevent-host-death family protein
MHATVTLKDIHDLLSELVNKVAYGEQKVVITRFGKPIAALITYQEYEQLMDPHKRFAPEAWEQGFTLMEKARTHAKQYPVKQVDDAIDAAVADIRRRKRV